MQTAVQHYPIPFVSVVTDILNQGSNWLWPKLKNENLVVT